MIYSLTNIKSIFAAVKITLIAAIGKNNELGKDNNLLWNLPEDLKRFKKTTNGACMIMGRKTFDSIGKPLPNRTSIIITRDTSRTIEGAIVVGSLKQAFIAARKLNQEHAFVIGGEQIFLQSLPYADNLDITHVHEYFDADVFFPAIDLKKFRKISSRDFSADEKNKYNYSFAIYERIEKQERALFLDRDGVLNKELGKYITSHEEFQISNEIIPWLKQKNNDGYKLIVITNQGAIAKGLITHEKVREINERMRAEYAVHGIYFDEIYYCPHHTDVSQCLCRKPKSLMVEKAIARFNININESMMIGDHERDRLCAEGAGVLGIVIPSNNFQSLASI
jgi:dihydrofolate reductase